VRRRTLPTERLARSFEHPARGPEPRAIGYIAFPSLSFRVDLTGHCAEGGGSEVPMQITRSLSARIRKWLGLPGKRPATVPYGAGAWGR
jgi:hypothetical protein